MDSTALSAEELILWNDATARMWHTFLSANPAALAVACDIYKAKTVGELLQHIVAVELRYAERLAGLPVSEYASVPFGTADEILATHEKAIAIFRGVLTDSAYDWTEKMEFPTLSAGSCRSSRRSVFFHAMLHGVRHYAQLSTLVRQAGFSGNLGGDYLLMDLEKV